MSAQKKRPNLIIRLLEKTQRLLAYVFSPTYRLQKKLLAQHKIENAATIKHIQKNTETLFKQISTLHYAGRAVLDARLTKIDEWLGLLRENDSKHKAELATLDTRLTKIEESLDLLQENAARNDAERVASDTSLSKIDEGLDLLQEKPPDTMPKG
ncbi:MAG: hypothetical protein LBT47_13350 [Deltaproteobacteria bacterium]|jgi:flagellar motility protein MotE (MotC chaperone)|nr:hypothetical protein [Deltaproteobacteria bacterium]